MDGSSSKFRKRPFDQWASLPQDPFSLILDKLHELIDHLSVAAVCKRWRSNAKACNQTIQRWRPNNTNSNISNILPMLLIPTKLGRDGPVVLYSISEGKIYKNVELKSVPFTRRCCGSSHGWLAITDRITDEGLVVALVNPFKKALKPIYLPPLVYDKSYLKKPTYLPSLEYDEICKIRNAYFYEDYVFKVILSADPALSPNTCVVIVLYDIGMYQKCAFIKLGGEGFWTITQSAADWFCDVLFYKAQAYLVTRTGDIASLDVNNVTKSNIVNGQTIPKFYSVARVSYTHRAYLVESSKGDLLHIQRVETFINSICQTERFQVFKLVFDEKDRFVVERVKVSSLADDAVFIGANNSVSVLASKFSGCRPNSVYYTHESMTGLIPRDGDSPRHDMGIFSLKDGKITRHYSPHTNWKSPIWVVPPFDGM